MAEYISKNFVFSVDTVLGDFAGNTFGEDARREELGPIVDLLAQLEDPNHPDPPNYDGPVRAITSKDGTVLYPIDSDFGFNVTDFIGAVPKVRDLFYAEGWAGNRLAEDGETIIGLSISDAETDIFKSGAPLGTWAAGVGGNTVKASTEHYVVMQHVLSDQAFPGDDEAVFALDNDLMFIGGPYAGLKISQVNPAARDLNAQWYEVVQAGLEPNESTVTENIAFGNDYSITLKDDGKLLYRWGQVIKKPNDIRLSLSIDLPEDWTQSAVVPFLNQGFKVNTAYLVINHTITNNPNDQVRPEDYENEAAKGRLPAYTIDDRGTPSPADDIWYSLRDSFTGDGTYIPKGTVFKDPSLIIPGGASSDLAQGFTNEWYTSTDRDPFEWAYDADPDPKVQNYVGFRSPEEAALAGFTPEDLVSGPRWRLTSNKFGQDLPGVEIPLIPNSEPPFTKDNIKYEVGEFTTTVLNLLDWSSSEASPLRHSQGWTTADPSRVNAVGVTPNGLKLTEAFDVAFYFKGDVKAATIYDAQLVVNYDEVDPVFDMLWRNPTTGATQAWFIEAGEQVGSAPMTFALPDPTWQIVGLGDFQGDGEKDDLIWRNSVTGENSIWFTDLTENGVTPVGGDFITPVPWLSWAIGGVGDFDGDGFQDDPIWFNQETEAVVVWFLDHGQPTGAADIIVNGSMGPGWEIGGVGAFDGGEAIDDVVWRNSISGQNVIWFLDGVTPMGDTSITTVNDPAWRMEGVADFRGDGIANDILWRNGRTTTTTLWYFDGATSIGSVENLQPLQSADFQVVA